MPSAVPCRAGGVHRDTNAAPTANDEPAIPMKNAAATRDAKLVVIGTANAASAEKIRSAVKTGRPPYLSVSMPIGSRATEPSRTGTATRSAVRDAVSEWRAANAGASPPTSPQAANERVNE